MKARISNLQPYAISILRIVVGFAFCEHGFQKLFGMFGGRAVHVTSLLGIAGVLEAFGGVLILAGLFTRPVAFLLCGEMAFAYFRQHAPRGTWPISNGGELAVLYCFVYLLLSATGAGPCSLDRLMLRRS